MITLGTNQRQRINIRTNLVLRLDITPLQISVIFPTYVM